MKLSNIKLVPVKNIRGTTNENAELVETFAQKALESQTLPAPIQVRSCGTIGEGFDTENIYEVAGDPLMLAVARRVRELSPRIGETAPVSIIDGFEDGFESAAEDPEEEMVRKAREATEFTILGR